MVTGFIFDILPLWLARLAELARNSGLYRLLSGLYQWVRRKAEQSMTCRLWQGSARLRTLIGQSALCHFLDRFFVWLTALAGKLGGWLVEPVRQSFTVCMLCKLPGFNFAWFYGGAFALIFLFPGTLWRNQYALILSLLLFALALLDAYRAGRPCLQTRDLGLGLLAFMFASAVGMGVSGNISEGIRVFCFYVTAFLLCMSMTCVLTDKRRLLSMLGFIYLTLVLTGVVAIAQRIIGVEVNASLTDLTVNEGMPGRVYSTLENPNNYAEFIVLAFPVSLVFCASLTDRRWKCLAFAGLCIPVGALLMTYSRSGWVSFALAALVFVALYNKRLLPLLVVAAFAAIPLLPESIFNRILTIGSTADSSNMYRIYIWQSVLLMIRDYGLTGIGLGPENFVPIYSYYSSVTATIAPHSHMLYLEVWLEMGVLGIASFLAMYLGTLRKGVRACSSKDPLIRLTLIACVSALAGIAFVCAAEYIWHYPRVLFAYFLILGITLAALRLAREEN